MLGKFFYKLEIDDPPPGEVYEKGLVTGSNEVRREGAVTYQLINLFLRYFVAVFLPVLENFSKCNQKIMMRAIQ